LLVAVVYPFVDDRSLLVLVVSPIQANVSPLRANRASLLAALSPSHANRSAVPEDARALGEPLS
jgi:hypothetical protein